MAGVAHFGGPETNWHTIGIMCSIVVFICGLVIIVAEADPGSELEIARRAIRGAEEARKAAEDERAAAILQKLPAEQALAGC